MGVATTYGVWLGLLGWLGPIVIGVCTGLMFVIQKNWVWASIGGVVGLLIFLFIVHYPLYFAGACLAHVTILTAKRYSYFKSWPELQPWLSRRGKAQ